MHICTCMNIFFKFNLLDIYLFDNIMMYKTLPYTIVIEPLLRMIHVRNYIVLHVEDMSQTII